MKHRISFSGLLLIAAVLTTAVAAETTIAHAEPVDALAQLQAEDALTVEEEIYFSPEELVTGPTKRAVKLEEAPANITIITHEEIARSGVQNLADVFRRVAGMDVVTISAADTEVSARGFVGNILETNRMAVLLDGRTFYLEFLGGTIWTQFPVPLDDIKRIEVIKGPLSSLYGNKAMLGIINIVTYAPDETRTRLKGAGGRYRYAEGDFINAGEFADGYWYKISGTYHRENEFSSQPGDVGAKDREDFTALAQFTFEPQEETELGLTGGFTQSTAKLQFGGLSTWEDRRGLLAGRAEHDFGRFGTLFFQSYWERHDATNQTFNLDPGDIDTVDAELRHTLAFDIAERVGNTTTYGFQYRYVDGTLAGVNAVHNIAGYLQDELRLYDLLLITGGVRVDYQKDYAGLNTSANGNLTFLIDPKYTMRLGIATAFNTPTLLYSFSNFNVPVGTPPITSVDFRGNQNLKAERILYVDMGHVIHPIDALRIRADLFYYRLNDMITPTLGLSNPTTGLVSFANDGGAEAIGGEVGLEGTIVSWLDGYANYAYEQFRTINGNANPTPNMGNPKHKVNAGLAGTWFEGRLTANADFHFVRRHQAQAGALIFANSPVVTINDLTLLNLRVGVWPIKDHLEVAVMANNVLNDRSPQVPAFDPTLGLPLAERPGWNIWGSLQYVF